MHEYGFVSDYSGVLGYIRHGSMYGVRSTDVLRIQIFFIVFYYYSIKKMYFIFSYLLSIDVS